jgi:hypothetical protein
MKDIACSNLIRFILLTVAGLCVVSTSHAASIGLAVSGNIGSAGETKQYDVNDSNKHNYDITRESVGISVISANVKEAIFSNHFELLYTMLQAEEGPNRYNLRGLTAVV